MIQIFPLNLDGFPKEEICAGVDQIVDSSNLLRDANDAHRCTLAKSFCIYKYGCACSMMAVYVSIVFNLEGAPYRSAVIYVNDKKVLKDFYCMVMLDGWPMHRYVDIQRNDDCKSWDADPVYLYSAFLVTWQGHIVILRDWTEHNCRQSYRNAAMPSRFHR